MESRRNLADLGFRSDSKNLHPLVQRAVFFNDALINVQKERVECEAALASLQSVLDSGGDVAQCITTISDVLGKELIMENLGLGAPNVTSRMAMEQDLLKARSELQSIQQNLGVQHPDVVALSGKIAMIEQFLQTSRMGAGNFQTDYLQNYFAPWLEQMLQNRLAEVAEKRGNIHHPIRVGPRGSRQPQRTNGAGRIARAGHQADGRHERRAVESDRLAQYEAERPGCPRHGHRGADRFRQPDLAEAGNYRARHANPRHSSPLWRPSRFSTR